METKKQANPKLCILNEQEIKFLKAEAAFAKDRVYQTLLCNLQENSYYFTKSQNTAKEIVSCLYHINVSCFESGLECEKDFEQFAAFLIGKLTI